MVCGEKISMRRRMICGKVRNSPGCHQQRTKLPLQDIIHSVVQGLRGEWVEVEEEHGRRLEGGILLS